MRKKISLLLCAVAVMLCFTACGSGREAEDVGYNDAAIEQTMEFMIQYCTNADESMREEFRNMKELNLDFQLIQSGIPVTAESFLGALDAWDAAVKECGEYEEHGEFTSEVTNDGYKVSADAKFSDRDATITFIFDSQSYMETMTVDAKYTTREILTKAGLNTLLGMGTVFAVLIFISLLIGRFKVIPALFGPKKKEEPVSTPSVSTPVGAPEVETAPETDDAELIAVIAAAIAAAREESGADEAGEGGFFVRSIRRRPTNKWKS